MLLKNKVKKKEDAVVRGGEKDDDLRVSQHDDYSGGGQKIGKEVDLEVGLTESRSQSNTAPADEIYGENAQVARQFFAALVGGNFVDWLDRKIRDGDYRKDLFEYWCGKYQEQELEDAWKLAQDVK